MRVEYNRGYITVPHNAIVKKSVSAIAKPHVIIDGVEHKHCYKCLCWLPLTEFSPRSNTSDKLYYECKECMREYERGRRHAVNNSN